MFSIYDGRESFYQWDLNRKLIVRDKSIKQVHFCNKTDDCSLVVNTYQDGEVTLADVPNILLTQDWRINVYGYDDLYTKYSACFKVKSRTKPADYVYTESEVMRWQDLEADMRQFMGEVQTAYDIAVKYGYEGTEEQWITELQTNAAKSAEAAEEQAKLAEQQANLAAKEARNATNAAGRAKASELNAKTLEELTANSAQEAQQAALNAINAKEEAAKSATEASNAKGLAESAANKAGSAATRAEAAAEKIESANIDVDISNYDFVSLLVEEDFLPAVYSANGKILTDSNNNAVLRY